MKTEGRNRLAAEGSPYLLQHKNNPVDWYPWGEEAFAAAKAANKPIFLSIGYSTCHWCHVMEHESFENDSIATLMNELFINIKVDREERPDVDHVYMRAVRAMTNGQGGWPLSVFLTPDLKPFFGGTYFPPDDRYGRPGFPGVLKRMSDVYLTQGAEIERVTASLVEFLQQTTPVAEDIPADTVLRLAYDQNLQSFDRTWGGFGGAPKFPRSMSLSFLMRYYRNHGHQEALDMVTVTLDKMADGGMYDHLGGGFHRYSTDTQWLVPHFEKMLYDNALLVRSYLEAYQLTKIERYARIAREILSYLMRDMQDAGGAFYAAEDADSEGEEGIFYIWSPAEIQELLGTDAEAFMAYYQVSEGGNFEGHNILWTPRDLAQVATSFDTEPAELQATLARNRATLLEYRSKRERPHRDEKVLTSWNGLVLSAFAMAYQVLGDEAYLESARGIAAFIQGKMWDGTTLNVRSADGDVRFDGYLDDYAFVAAGMFDLYESDFDSRHLSAAFELLDAAEGHFATPQGGYYFAPASNTELLARSEEVYDGATPSGNSVMVLNLLKRAEYTGDLKYRDRALGVLRAYRDQIVQHPASFPQMLCALDFLYSKPQEIVIAGSPELAAAFLQSLREGFHPNKVVLLTEDGEGDIAQLAPVTRGKKPQNGEPMAYVCQDFACKQPTTDPQEMLSQLR